ncbi:sugar kinase [Fulvivirga sedimenti]|uniref:Sugar kinase n=1 Tax=Fulvivirga sedimenti TaxID=2879465 RepID=A0A9X1HVL6_9BACT|nr:sugar kinase [Fulvivirga sedimenti]MCA6078696.1 sugar kinase [Fulvivirga sedimenti]
MVLSLGELILRFGTINQEKFEQASQFGVSYGGSEANVLIALGQFEMAGRMLSRVTDNPIGQTACRKLHAFGIDTSYISYGGDRMGLYYLEHGASVRAGNIIYDRKNASFNTLRVEDVNWDSLFEGITWFHWSGITPALSQNAADLCRKSVEEAASREIPISCDLHFRKTLWDYGISPLDVIPELLGKTSLLVGDPLTIARMTGDEFANESAHLDDKEILEFFRKTSESFPSIQTLAMLSREVISASDNKLKGILFEGQPYLSSTYRVSPIVDRIGGGDAFMAGLIYGKINEQPLQETIEFATAAGAYKHTVSGDHLVGSADDIKSIISASHRGKLNR